MKRQLILLGYLAMFSQVLTGRTVELENACGVVLHDDPGFPTLPTNLSDRDLGEELKTRSTQAALELGADFEKIERSEKEIDAEFKAANQELIRALNLAPSDPSKSSAVSKANAHIESLARDKNILSREKSKNIADMKSAYEMYQQGEEKVRINTNAATEAQLKATLAIDEQMNQTQRVEQFLNGSTDNAPAPVSTSRLTDATTVTSSTQQPIEGSSAKDISNNGNLNSAGGTSSGSGGASGGGVLSTLGTLAGVGIAAGAIPMAMALSRDKGSDALPNYISTDATAGSEARVVTREEIHAQDHLENNEEVSTEVLLLLALLGKQPPVPKKTVSQKADSQKKELSLIDLSISAK